MLTCVWGLACLHRNVRGMGLEFRSFLNTATAPEVQGFVKQLERKQK